MQKSLNRRAIFHYQLKLERRSTVFRMVPSGPCFIWVILYKQALLPAVRWYLGTALCLCRPFADALSLPGGNLLPGSSLSQGCVTSKTFIFMCESKMVSMSGASGEGFGRGRCPAWIQEARAQGWPPAAPEQAPPTYAPPVGRTAESGVECTRFRLLFASQCDTVSIPSSLCF